MKKVLVIGGTGFIGLNIVKKLISHNVNVSIYDIKKCDQLGIDCFEGNIKDDVDFCDIISGFDSIIYLITTVSPKKSMENPELTYIEDIPLLIKTLDACIKNNVRQVIFASSGGTIYGDNNGHKSKEEDFNEPINHYGVGKLTCEKILEMYNKLYGMENISLRISNSYGLGQNPKSGVGVITAFTEQVKNGETINLFGDGSITRDFIDVSDVAEAFYLALNWNFDKNINPIFNIGSGKGITLKQVVNLVYDVLGKEKNINYLPERPFDVKYSVLDINKAKEYLGYKPDNNEILKIKKYVEEKASKEMIK